MLVYACFFFFVRSFVRFFVALQVAEKPSIASSIATMLSSGRVFFPVVSSLFSEFFLGFSFLFGRLLLLKIAYS
jgi:hypothetical protein